MREEKAESGRKDSRLCRGKPLQRQIVSVERETRRKGKGENEEKGERRETPKGGVSLSFPFSSPGSLSLTPP